MTTTSVRADTGDPRMSLPPRTTLDELFTRELELCGVSSGDEVGVLTQGRKRLVYADAVRNACSRLGASVIHVDIPSDGYPDDGGEFGVRAAETGLSSFSPVLVKTFQACDLLVDLVFLLWSQEQAAIKAAGTKIISCVEPPDALKRLFPDARLRERVLRADELIAGASRMRVTSDAGTDVTYELGQYGRIQQYGFSDEPGRWDHFASALVGTVGNDEGVTGTVVLAPGDIIFPTARYVSDPVTIEIHSGRITAVDGGVDAMLMRDVLRRYDDENAYGISHIGWGMNGCGRWDVLPVGGWESEALGISGIGMDSRSYLGSVMFSTGPNVEFGGTNATACHMDIPMRNCSVYLDDEQIIDAGRVLPEALKPTPAAA